MHLSKRNAPLSEADHCHGIEGLSQNTCQKTSGQSHHRHTPHVKGLLLTNPISLIGIFCYQDGHHGLQVLQTTHPEYKIGTHQDQITSTLHQLHSIFRYCTLVMSCGTSMMRVVSHAWLLENIPCAFDASRWAVNFKNSLKFSRATTRQLQKSLLLYSAFLFLNTTTKFKNIPGDRPQK